MAKPRNLRTLAVRGGRGLSEHRIQTSKQMVEGALWGYSMVFKMTVRFISGRIPYVEGNSRGTFLQRAGYQESFLWVCLSSILTCIHRCGAYFVRLKKGVGGADASLVSLVSNLENIGVFTATTDGGVMQDPHEHTPLVHLEERGGWRVSCLSAKSMSAEIWKAFQGFLSAIFLKKLLKSVSSSFQKGVFDTSWGVQRVLSWGSAKQGRSIDGGAGAFTATSRIAFTVPSEAVFLRTRSGVGQGSGPCTLCASYHPKVRPEDPSGLRVYQTSGGCRKPPHSVDSPREYVHHVLRILRLIGFCTMFLGALGGATVYRLGLFLGREWRMKWMWRGVVRGLLFCAGVTEVVCQGDVPPKAGVVVSNHISYLDILVLAGVLDCAFISKKEVEGWPVIGWAAKCWGSLFVTRQSRDSLQDVHDLQIALDRPWPIAFFPEATTGEGVRLLPFKTAYFQLPLGTRVHPVSLCYEAVGGLPARSRFRKRYSWRGKVSLASHLWDISGMPGVRVRLIYHPVLIASGDRKHLAKQAHEAVQRGV